jgi:hypothetical protein
MIIVPIRLQAARSGDDRALEAHRTQARTHGRRLLAACACRQGARGYVVRDVTGRRSRISTVGRPRLMLDRQRCSRTMNRRIAINVARSPELFGKADRD